MMRSVVDPTAFSHGQIVSKLWLCDELNELWWPDRPLIIWVYGGWYCVTNLLLRTRNFGMEVGNVCAFDIDPAATENARMINNTWECEGQFRAFTLDCN